MEWERQMAYKYREGIAEGKQQKAEETAKNFLKMHLGTYEQISQGTGLPVEKIKELEKEIH